MINQQVIRRGEIAGVICMFALVLSLVAFVFFGSGQSVTGDLIALGLYLVIFTTYYMLIMAVREIVHSVDDVTFSRRMRDMIAAMVISCFVLAPTVAPIFFPVALVRTAAVASVLAVLVLGIVSIRLAPYFESLNGRYAADGKKAGKWLKISGWLMATVILSFIGVFLSLVADIYLWRLVRQERRAAE